MSLLRLPTQIRLAIYAYAGAPSIGTPHGCPEGPECVINRELSDIININLNHRSAESSELSTPTGFTTLSLLLSCSAIYNELSQHIYSNCQIVIRARDDSSLSALSKLRPSSIHALRRLAVDLNATSCGWGWCCDDEQDPNFGQESQALNGEEDLAHETDPDPLKLFRQYKAAQRTSDWQSKTQRSDNKRNDGDLDSFSIANYSRSQPLTVTNDLHAAVLRNWHRIWIEQVRPYLQPATLELDFSCDVVDVETGQLALAPFLTETRPYLARCNIRLARRKIEALRELARSAVERVVCPAELRKIELHSTLQQVRRRKNPCSFMDLPTEIRSHIFEYTDLVAPNNEVEWSPHRGWYIRRGEPFFVEHCMPELLHLHPIAKDKSETTDDAFEYRANDLERAHCQEKLGGRGCFCKSRHTVYSSYSKLNCWAPPTPLFLICSVIRQDALQVFFGQNRITVWAGESIGWVDPLQSSPGRLHISTFLMDIVPRDALRYMRYVEIVFGMPYLEGYSDGVLLDWCSAGSTELMDWERTVEEIKTHVVSSNLSITVFFPSDMGRYLYPEGPDHDYQPSEAEFERQKTCLYNAILPLQQLTPLKYLRVSIWGYPGGDEITKTIMGPSYEPPDDYTYRSAGLPIPLFARRGRWLSDAQRFK